MSVCANCGKNFTGGVNGVIKTMGGWGARHLPFCSNRCRDEYQDREDAKHAAKVAKKEAKQAAREEEEYESGGGSSSSSSGGGFANSFMGNVIAAVVLILLLIVVIGVIFSKDEDASDPAVKMAKWEEHLEKRRAAFAEGLTEEGVEARGLKNFTWEEWQARQKAPQEKSKPVKKEATKSLSDLWHEHQDTRRNLLVKGMSSQEVDEMGYEALAYDEFKTRYAGKDAEAELKKLNARVDELIKERKEAAARERAMAEARAKVEAEVKAKAEAEAKAKRESQARAEAKAKAEAEAKAKEATPKPAAGGAISGQQNDTIRRRTQQRTSGQQNDTIRRRTQQGTSGQKNDAIYRRQQQGTSGQKNDAIYRRQQQGTSGQKNDTIRKKASADSKVIGIVVQGKGKTKEVALHYAICEAVWRTVGVWVGSKTRMQEHHDQVVALVKTVREADIRKYEVLETQQQNGEIVLKVRVSVSKMMIAPKFAQVFPDVFGNRQY